MEWRMIGSNVRSQEHKIWDKNKVCKCFEHIPQYIDKIWASSCLNRLLFENEIVRGNEQIFLVMSKIWGTEQIYLATSNSYEQWANAMSE